MRAARSSRHGTFMSASRATARCAVTVTHSRATFGRNLARPFFLNPRSLLRRRDWRQRNRRTAAPPPQATLLAATTTLTTLIGASGHRLQLQLRRKRRATTERTAPPPPPRFRSRTRFRHWRSFWPLRCQRMNTRHESICAPTGRSGGVSRVSTALADRSSSYCLSSRIEVCIKRPRNSYSC